MPYGNFKDLNRRTASEAFNIDECQRGLASMVYKFFDKKLLVVALKMKYF